MMFKNRWKKAACLILTMISTVCLGKVDVKAADYWPLGRAKEDEQRGHHALLCHKAGDF